MFSDQVGGAMYGVLDDEDGLLGECDIDDGLSFCGQVGENGNAQEKTTKQSEEVGLDKMVHN